MINTKNLCPIELASLIRIGRANDGGYVIPAEVFSISDGLLSYGINKDWSFEKDFWKNNTKAYIHCYDHSVNFFSLIIFTIKSFFLSIIHLLLLDKKRLSKVFYGLFVIPNYYSFFRKKRIYFKNKIWYNNYGINITVEDSLSKIYKSGARNIFLKMDIETAEYLVLNDIFKTNKNIIGMAIEFHKIDEFTEEFNSIINKILKKYHIVHIHGNNYGKLIEEINFPSILEITFLSKKCVKGPIKKSTKKYPVKDLDQPNRASKEDYNLIF